jgi:hypothetical protein
MLQTRRVNVNISIQVRFPAFRIFQRRRSGKREQQKVLFIPHRAVLALVKSKAFDQEWPLSGPDHPSKGRKPPVLPLVNVGQRAGAIS